MDLLTFGVPSDDVPVIERLASVAVDLSRYQLEPAFGASRVASPPALTPLLKGFGSAYLGLWRHPVVPGRTLSYVEYVWETSRAREIARTAEQLVAWIFVHVLETVDDRQTDPRWSELEQEAAALGLADLAQFYDATLEGTDALLALPMFKTRPPRDATSGPRADYDGEFPRADDPSSAASAAGCEVPVDASPDWLAAARAVAPWLGPGSPVSVFSDRLAADDPAGSWLALNSPGWPTEPVEHALERLTEASESEGLRLLADDWQASTDRRTGGY